MKPVVFVLALLVLAVPTAAYAQDTSTRSPQKAFVRSLLVPGWGHRYARGDWNGAATGFLLAEVGLWTGVGVATWQRGAAIDSYEALARTEAGADLDGKDRRFFIELATYASSDAYLEAQLRNRAWDDLGYVSDPAFQWAWTSDDAFRRYRDLRDESDALGNRRTLFIAALVGNRLVAALTSIRAANRASAASRDVALSFSAPPEGSTLPLTRLQVRF